MKILSTSILPWILSLALLVPCLFSRAQEEQASESETKAEVVEVYKSENASSFEPADGVRNPFWPVGWTPPPKGEKEQPVETKTIPTVPPDLFRLSSTLTGQPAIAVIDGRDYMVGQALEKDVQDQTVKFRVLAIRDGLVVLSYAGGTVTIRN